MFPANMVHQPIRPTLYIGLGGTGKEVLLRLRRRFYERFRTGVLPCTRFLWMDTDTRDLDARGKAFDAALSSVAFEEQEKVALLNGTVGEAATDIFRNRQKWSYIHNWLYDEVETYGREISNGAGGVRAVGRLMFMTNFTNIESAVKRALMGLREATTLVETQRFYGEHGLGEADMDPNGLPMVCVVSSVAGGTGAGTLLDLTFLLRYLEGTVQGLDSIASYVFLPNVYYSDANAGERAGRSYGNAYAALKELDHFCLRIAREGAAQGGGVGIDFDVTWQDKRPLKVTGPPDSVTYLLEMRNTAGVSLASDNRGELFSMLAESLYLDLLPGPFASAKRSDYSNIVQSLAGPAGVNSETGGVKLPQTFSRRFASCGLSKIEVPQDMIRAACAAQLGADVGAYLLRDLPDQNVGMEVRNDMAHAELDRDGIPSLFKTEWKSLIDGAVEDVFRRSAIKQPADVVEIGVKLDDLEKKLTYALGNDRVKWGDAIKHLRNQSGPVAEDAKRRCETLLRERALENPARGLNTAMRDGGYLDECIAGLKALGSPEEAGVPAAFPSNRDASAKDALAWTVVRKDLLDEMTQAMTGFTVKALGASDWTLSILVGRLKDAAKQVLLCQAEACLFVEANKTALAVIKLLEQRKKDLQKFVEFAQIYARESADRAADLQNVESATQVLIFRLYDKTKHWESYYCLGRDQDSGDSLKVDSEKEYAKLAGVIGTNAGILDMAASLEREGRAALSKKIDKYCEDRFADDFRANPRAVDVLEHPFMQGRRRQEFLQRLVNAALPMLRQNPRLGAMKAEIDHVAYLGVADPEVPKYKELKDEIDNLLHGRAGQGYRVEAHATGNPAEVYLYLSDYAFSLPLLPIIEHDAHTAYWDFYDRINQAGAGNAQQLIPLHLSKRWEGKFEDLKVYDDQEADTLREVISIVLFGQMLKVLMLKEQKGLHFYYYMLGQPFSRPEPIGPRRQVIASLLQDSKLRKTLNAAIEQRENSLTSTPERLVVYHRAVQAAANSPELIRKTPDDLLLGQKLVKLREKGVAALQQDLDKITKIDQPLRYEYLRKLENSGIEWVLDAYPAIQDIDVWELPI